MDFAFVLETEIFEREDVASSSRHLVSRLSPPGLASSLVLVSSVFVGSRIGEETKRNETKRSEATNTHDGIRKTCSAFNRAFSPIPRVPSYARPVAAGTPLVGVDRRSLIERFPDSSSNPESGPNSPPTVNNSQASPTAGGNAAAAIQEVSAFFLLSLLSLPVRFFPFIFPLFSRPFIGDGKHRLRLSVDQQQSAR